MRRVPNTPKKVEVGDNIKLIDIDPFGHYRWDKFETVKSITPDGTIRFVGLESCMLYNVRMRWEIG